jgi:hypothetical protein
MNREHRASSAGVVGVSLAANLDPEIALGVGLSVDHGAAVELVWRADDGPGLLPLLKTHQ